MRRRNSDEWDESFPEEEDYGEVWEIDATDAYYNGGYDEYGNQINCNYCGGEIVFDPGKRVWRCKECYSEKTRAQWFDYIDADPPGKKCLRQCRENYPLCKNWCRVYKIPDDDPIL